MWFGARAWRALGLCTMCVPCPLGWCSSALRSRNKRWHIICLCLRSVSHSLHNPPTPPLSTVCASIRLCWPPRPYRFNPCLSTSPWTGTASRRQPATAQAAATAMRRPMATAARSRTARQRRGRWHRRRQQPAAAWQLLSQVRFCALISDHLRCMHLVETLAKPAAFILIRSTLNFLPNHLHAAHPALLTERFWPLQT